MDVRNYWKKPPTFMAVMFDGAPDITAEIVAWVGADKCTTESSDGKITALVITAPEGKLTVPVGQYIVKNPFGHYYGMVQTAFEQLYIELK